MTKLFIIISLVINIAYGSQPHRPNCFNEYSKEVERILNLKVGKAIDHSFQVYSITEDGTGFSSGLDQRFYFVKARSSYNKTDTIYYNKKMKCSLEISIIQLLGETENIFNDCRFSKIELTSLTSDGSLCEQEASMDK
jgi:hypothetical protein